MSEDGRSLIRDAQAAEIRGDKDQARDLLTRAARLYEGLGHVARAEQLRRHAARLIGSEPGAEEPHVPAAPGQPEVPALQDRGPTRADPRSEAWCSFCCRPAREVGALVAGPAGAFICGSCLTESEALLGRPIRAGSTDPARGGAAARSPAVVTGPAATLSRVFVEVPEERQEPPPRGGREPRAPIRLSSQGEALAELEPLLERGGLRALLLGPAGTGKTRWLREWASRGLGTYVEAARSGWPEAPRAYLVDGLESLAPEQVGSLEQRLAGRAFVLSARGSLRDAALTVGAGAGQRPVYTTEALAMACGGRVPLSLLESAREVVRFEVMGREDLERLGAAWAEGRGAGVDAALLRKLADAAEASARGAHELIALLERAAAGLSHG